MNMKNKVFISFFFCILMISSCGFMKKDVPGYRGKVLFLHGNIMINDEFARIDQMLGPRCVIMTDPKAICDIELFDKTIIRIDENSEVLLNMDRYDRYIDIKSGTLKVVLKQAAVTNGYSFTIRTPLAYLGIQEGLSFVRIEGPGRTYVCLCQGGMRIRDIDLAFYKEFRSFYHTAFRIIKKGKKIMIRKAKKLFHSDRDMGELAEKINEGIKWGKTGRGHKR